MTVNYTTGYAGTGKSTALLELMDSLPTKTSVVLAPTHKALERLRSSTKSPIELKTIHSLLGWIPGINENAKKIGHIDTVIKLEKEIDAYKDIVIDEAGMMSEDMLCTIISKLEELNNYETDHITLHLFLDPYQLLPVKGIQIQTDPLTTTNLTTQHRGESPDVVALFTKFVNYLEGSNTSDLTTPASENVIHVSNIKDFKEGDRLLTYTNEAAGKWNKTIAKHLGITQYEGQEVQLGSMIDTVVVDSFHKPTYGELLDRFNDRSLVLQNGQISAKYLEASLKALINPKSKIEFIKSGTRLIPVICGIGNAHKIRNNAKEAALRDKSKFKYVYALNRAFTLDFNFASTVHKMQGQEVNNVFIDKKDLQRSIWNGNYNNYSRLMYVAISRAKKKIYIL